MGIVKKLYSAATLAISLPLFPLMLLKARGRARIWERYGSWSLSLEDCVWFHGASMGEMNGLIPVMKRVKAQYPELPLLVTSTTVTGLEKVKDIADHARLLPLDSSFWIKRALKAVKPRVLVFSETEIWPDLIDYLDSRRIPMFLVNARISDYSFPNYQRMKVLFGPALRKLQALLVSSKVSRDRFIEIGADSSKVEVLGNAKYDTKLSVNSLEEAQRLKQRFFGEDLPVLVLGSLRPGEDDFWFPQIAAAYAAGKRFNLVVAPRHVEKFDFFATQLEKAGLQFVRWSKLKAQGESNSTANVVLLDTLGDLNAVYSFAKVSFVGASLVNIGGHNPLEPAAYGACVVMGPYVANAPEVVALLKEQQAHIELSSDLAKGSQEIADLIDRLCKEDKTLCEVAERGHKVWLANTGVAEKIFERIKVALAAKG